MQMLEEHVHIAGDLRQVLAHFENLALNFSIQKQNDFFNTSHMGIPLTKYEIHKLNFIIM